MIYVVFVKFVSVPRTVSVGILFAMQRIGHGLVDDEQVQSERPVFDVPDVAADTSLHILQLFRFAAVARHLDRM